MSAADMFVSQKMSDELPEWASAYAVLMNGANTLELLDEVSERLKVVRQGGYTSGDIFPTLVAYLSSRIPSIKEFSSRCAPHRSELAAMARRRDWASSSSISRYLTAATHGEVDAFISWLLAESSPLDPMLGAPAEERDRNGNPVRFFDWDPKVLTFRQRGLPDIAGMPAARRRSHEASSGYPGRKRGNAQFSRSLVQHTASGWFVGLKTASGNGVAEDFCQHALESVLSAAARCAWAPDECVLRMDGGLGSVRILAACKRAGVGYLSRLSHYSLLSDTQVIESMEQNRWQPVRDSGSGPRREALDLGRFEFRDTTSSEMIETRVIVSRYKTDHPRGAGKEIGDGMYELFAVSREDSAWTAGEVVENYYARSGAENRYAQLDRELGIDRTFSYHMAGQQLATGVALWIWNFQTLLGYRMSRAAEPEPEPRSHTDVSVGPRRANPDLTDLHVESWADLPVDWQHEAQQRGFVWDPQRHLMVCTRGKDLDFYRIRGRVIEFRGKKKYCDLCPIRSECSSSRRTGFRKMLGVTVSEELAPSWMEEHEYAPPRRIRPPDDASEGRPPQISGLFPAELRHSVRQAFHDVALRVTVTGREPPPPREIRRLRQRRRLDWQERHQRNALHAESVIVELRAPPRRVSRLARLLDAIATLKTTG